MLEAILGSTNRERVLMYLHTQGSGYAREIAASFQSAVTPIQKQLTALEEAGVITCQPQGRTRVYSLDPRYPFLSELEALLNKALSLYPPQEQARLTPRQRQMRRTDTSLPLGRRSVISF
ncbi:MAG TPA: ArsR family transcriptional regulator [Moraxellaceae bacterium]|nr:ArsR family transcriptional regulator [Moraxellaceae bacterium]